MSTSSKNTELTDYHVPNLVRALRIFELLSQRPEGLTTAEITEIFKIPRNSVFRITSTLLENGYLLRDEETKAFRLSIKLLTIGYAAISEKSLIEKSLDIMRKLRDRYKETVPLGILNGLKGIVIEEVSGLHSFRYVLEPGREFHLHTAAAGKAILAFLPGDEQGKICDQINYIKYNDRTVKNKKEFLKILQEVKTDGYAIDHAEEIEGMHCIGAPVFNRNGYPIAAIWITGPSIRIHEKDFAKIGEDVKKSALKISRNLGYTS
jgi:DNA-binding IclR family transcriptional regulator